jgi:hypothetical protein
MSVKRYDVPDDFAYETRDGGYVKAADFDALASKYSELLLQVFYVVPGESRHETAKRIIYQHENQPSHGPGIGST